MSLLKALLKTAFGVLVACVTLLAIALILALTPWGLNLTVAAVQKAYPTLIVEKTQGSLLNATLEGVRFEDAGVNISAKSLSYSLANIAILDRFVSVAYVATEGLKVDIRSSATSTNEVSAEFSQENATDEGVAADNSPTILPVGFELTSLSMTDTDVAMDETRIHIGSFETSLKGFQSKVTIGQTSLEHLQVAMPPAPEKAPQPLAQIVSDFFEAPLLADLGEVKLPLEVEITKFSLQDLSFNNQKFVDTLGLKLNAKNSDIRLTKIEAVTPFARFASDVVISTSGSWPIATHLVFRDVAVENFGNLAGNATLEGGLLSGLKIDAAVTEPKTMHLVGTVDPSRPELPLDLTLTAQVNLPEALIGNALGGEAWLDIRTVKLSGSFTDWALDVKTSATLPTPYPATEVDLRLKGQKLAFDYALSVVPQTSAKVEIDGNALLTNDGLKLSADTSAEVSDIDQLLKSIDIKVNHALAKGNATLKSTFQIQTDESFAHYQANIADLQLTGKLAGTPLNLQLEASANEAMDIDVTSFVATLARNRVQGSGTYQKTGVDAKASIQATELFLLDPKLTGKVTGDVSISGALDAINLKTKVSAQRLKYDTYFADRVNLVADIRALGKTDSKVALTLSGIDASGQSVDKVSLTLVGTQVKHTLGAKADSTDTALNFSWSGNWNDTTQVWNSTLTRGALRVAQTRWIATDKPAMSVNVARQSFTVGKHCWAENTSQARVCINDSAHIAQAGSASLNFTGWPLSFAQGYAPAGVRLMGKVKGDLKAKWTAPDVKEMSLEANLDAAGAGLRAVVSEKPVQVALKTAKLSAILDKNTAQADVTVAITPDNPLKALVTVTDPTGKAEMSAKVTSNKLSLDEFSGIVSAISPLTKTLGYLTTDLTLTGTPQAPLVRGKVDISALQLYGPTIPLDMQPSNFALTFSGKNSQFTGKLVSSEGPLFFEGKADWSDIKAPTASVHVKGKNFRVVSAPYVKALVTPDVSVTVDEKRIALSGKISIPEAHLSAESIPESAVTVSGDEVIVDADMKPLVKEASRPLTIDSSLAIALGENVRVQAFGLAAQLKGTVTVTQTNDTLGLRGTLTMPDGRFQAYGQDLVIKKGSFIFAGPVNDPIVELVAQRNPDSVEDDVTVGIRVSGNVSQMKSEIFSDPSMDQASQLSYLLRGRGLESNAEDNSMLSSALLTVGLSQAGQLISGIGDALMIRDLGVSTQGVGDNSQVVVSGYVLPDLQVKYAMSIFDSLSTLTLRYRLMPKLFVEASSGVNQAIDVLYNFEF